MKNFDTTQENAVSDSNQDVFDIEHEISCVRGSVKKRDGELISILSSAYEIYHKVETEEDEKEEFITEIDRLLSNLGGSKPTKTHTKIIQLIFGESDMDRRRVSTYAAVMRNAYEAGTAATDFSTWLKNSGGIDKASRSEPTSSEDLSVDMALDLLSLLDPIGVLDGKEISKHIKKSDCEFKLAICIWDASSEQLKAYRLVENEKAIASAFKPFAESVFNEVGESQQPTGASEKAANDEDKDDLEAA